jgi:hypothetical protein
MNPIRNLNEVLKHWDVFENECRSVYAFFLYTSEDKNLAKYVHEHFVELDKLSGEDYLIFLVEQPPDSWNGCERAKRYWSADATAARSDSYVGYFNEGMPYDPAEVYAIARFLGVRADKLPALVFFRNILDKHLLVYPLDRPASDESLTQEFRALFGRVSKPSGSELRSKKSTWDDLDRFVRNRNASRGLTQLMERPLVSKVGEILQELAKRLAGNLPFPP